jgi:uncharacterized protein with NRDE domain
MLRLYRLLFSIMSETYITRGDTTAAVRADSVAQAIERNLQGRE